MAGEWLFHFVNKQKEGRVTDEVDIQCYAGIPAQTWNFGSDGSLSIANKAQCLDLTG
jgi:hypothetical protein